MTTLVDPRVLEEGEFPIEFHPQEVDMESMIRMTRAYSTLHNPSLNIKEMIERVDSAINTIATEIGNRACQHKPAIFVAEFGPRLSSLYIVLKILTASDERGLKHLVPADQERVSKLLENVFPKNPRVGDRWRYVRGFICIK